MVASRSLFRGIAWCACGGLFAVAIAQPWYQARLTARSVRQHAECVWSIADQYPDAAWQRARQFNLQVQLDALDAELARASQQPVRPRGDFTAPGPHRLD